MGFDAAKAVEATAKWIRDWFEKTDRGAMLSSVSAEARTAPLLQPFAVKLSERTESSAY